jgi:putative toxin-antitoxin system antitoxin component (TIGR02293 family)
VSAAEVAAILGGTPVLKRKVTSELDLAELVRAGLPSSALDHVLETLAAVESQAAIYRVVGRARTLQRKRAAHVALSSDESDRLARLARLVARAEAALGTKDKARRWLVTPNRVLAGSTPLSLLDSDAGSLLVERVLGRVEHGIFS